MRSITVSRDIHYYGNCDLNDRVLYRIHDREDRNGRITLSSSLSRVSDGFVIAHLLTTKMVDAS